MPPPTAWPADPAALGTARHFLRRAASAATLLVPDGDADGLSAGMLVRRALEGLGGTVRVAFAGKGEHVHHPGLRRRVEEAGARALVVLDMGSRGEPIVPGLPTLVVDHHQPRGFPPGATVLSAFGHEPVATTSLLAFTLVEPLAPGAQLAWLAALGTVGDLGPAAPLPGFAQQVRRHGRRHLSEAVALLNAPRRSAAHDVETAWRVLERAHSPADIALGRVEGSDTLRRRRAQVRAETDRCASAAPRFAGRFALITIRSAAKVHPLLARRWSQRLRGYVVLVANAGYLPGRVNFSMRSVGDEDLIELLRGLGTPADAEVAYGHPRATGGSLDFEQFARVLVAMGFSAEIAPEPQPHGLPAG